MWGNLWIMSCQCSPSRGEEEEDGHVTDVVVFGVTMSSLVL